MKKKKKKKKKKREGRNDPFAFPLASQSLFYVSVQRKKTHVTAIQASNHSESKKRRSRSVGPPLEEVEVEVEAVAVVAVDAIAFSFFISSFLAAPLLYLSLSFA